MAMIEKLFVQIFERKAWIIDQVDQQSRVFDQHLASKLLIDGITPPPWLFDSDRPPNRTSGNSDLKAEKLISELLLGTRPAIPFSYSRSNVYEDAFAETSERGFSNGMGTEISGRNVNNPELVSAGVSMLDHRDDDHSITSPQDQRDTIISDIGHDHALSLARLQRSRSRQKALEIRRSANKVNRESVEDTNRSEFSGGANDSVVCSFQDYQVEESGLAETLDTQNVKLDESRSKVIGSGINSEKITRLKSSAWDANLGSELASESRVGEENRGETVAQVGEKRKTASKSIGEKRITRARSNMSQGPSTAEPELKAVHSNDHDTLITDTSLICKGSQTLSRRSSDTRRFTRSRNNVSQVPSIPEPVPMVGQAEINEKMITGSIFAGSNSSRSHRRTQIKKERSSFIGEEEEECAANSTDSSDKENVAEPSSVVEVMSNLFNSGYVGQRVTRSKSAASHNPLVSKLSNRFEAVGSEKVSGLNGHASTLKEAEVDQVRSVEARSVGSGSEPEVLVPCPGHSSIPVEPRQHDFTFKPLDFNSNSSPALREEEDGKLLEEKEPLALSESAGIVENCGLHLEQRGDVSTEEELQKGNFEARPETSDTAIEALPEHVVSPVKETPRSTNVVVTNNLQQTKKCSKEKSSPGSIYCRIEIGSARLAIPAEVASNESGPETSVSIDHYLAKDAESFQGTKADHFEDREAVTDVGVELCCPEIKGESALNLEPEHDKLDISQCHDDSNLDRCQSSKSQILATSKGKSSLASSIDRLLTWGKEKLFNPQEEDVVVNKSCKSRVLSREENAVLDIGSGIEVLLSEEHSPKGIQKAEHLEIPHEDAELSIPGRNQDEEMHHIGEQNLEDGSESSPQLQEENLQEGSESSPKAASEMVGEEKIREGSASLPKSQLEELDQVEERNQMEHNFREIYESSQFVEHADFSLKERSPSANIPFTFDYEEFNASFVPSISKHSVGDTEHHLMEEPREDDPTSMVSNRDWKFIFDHNENLSLLKGNFGYSNGESSMIQEKKSDPAVIGSFSHDDDDTMPVHESFVFRPDDEQCCTSDPEIGIESLNLPKTTIERAGILEQLCESACMKTPLSYSLDLGKLYQSVPTGLLEGVDVKDKHPESDESGHAFQERPHSDSFQNLPNSREWDIKKTCLSPVQKVWERIMSKSASTEKKKSLNPELPCINEESESIEEVIADSHQGMDLDAIGFSLKREPLAGINENVPMSETEICLEDRYSLDSVNTEFSFNVTQNEAKNNLENSKSMKRRYNSRNKENENQSLGTYSRDGNLRSLQKLINKQKLSSNAIPRKIAPGLTMEPKRSNIVSNISSFIPLVQQKQAAAITTGKRDVKVKALEAAEAAKQLAEKKENERKIKKEAMKLERARMEQENLKQLELQKKRKEEERKKKEAEIAAKKRQREEDEKKEKERKRLRVEETRKQQKENEQKLQALKEEKEKSRAMVEKGRAIKESKSEKANISKMEKVKEDVNLQRISETEPSTTRASTSKDRIGREEFEAPSDMVNNLKANDLALSTENLDAVSVSVDEPSYDISPYKSSDDEYEDFDEDDDDNRPKKFVPSWTSKKKVALAIFSQDSRSPWEIFKPSSFCSISEVVLPRRFQI